MEEFLKQINEDVRSTFYNEIETSKTFVVPNRDDSGLTFSYNEKKKGKLIETCVLFIDIRNSTKMSRSLKDDKIKLGKIYASFISAMTKIADEFGFVRNIVGDRVMVVFEPRTCFMDSIKCAEMMRTVSLKIIREHSGQPDFQVGIGIDFGEMLILKTGQQRRYKEQSEYKGLIWVGDAANIASKLTDFASKEYYSPIYKVTFEELKLEKISKGYVFKPKPSLTLANRFDPSNFQEQFEYKTNIIRHVSTMVESEFIKKVDFGDEIKYNGKKVISIKKEPRTGTTAPILISGTVYNGLRNSDSKSPYLTSLTKREYPNQPLVRFGIYGGFLLNKDINKITIK